MEEIVATVFSKESQFNSSVIQELSDIHINHSSSEIFGSREQDLTRIIDESKLQEFVSDSFYRKGFISNETWEKDLNIQAQVVNSNNEYVECDCLMDKENLYFETRSFPRFIFDKIESLHKNPFIIVNIKSKAGSIRFDISDGEKRVNKKYFEFRKQWDNLDSSDLDTPLDKPINI